MSQTWDDFVNAIEKSFARKDIVVCDPLADDDNSVGWVDIGAVKVEYSACKGFAFMVGYDSKPVHKCFTTSDALAYLKEILR